MGEPWPRRDPNPRSANSSRRRHLAHRRQMSARTPGGNTIDLKRARRTSSRPRSSPSPMITSLRSGAVCATACPENFDQHVEALGRGQSAAVRSSCRSAGCPGTGNGADLGDGRPWPEDAALPPAALVSLRRFHDVRMRRAASARAAFRVGRPRSSSKWQCSRNPADVHADGGRHRGQRQHRVDLDQHIDALLRTKCRMPDPWTDSPS